MRVPEIRRPGPCGLLLALLLAWSGAQGAMGKPLPPLAVLWQVDSTAEAGTHHVVLTLTARDAFTELGVRVGLPPGFTLLEGETAWSGPLASDASRDLAFTVRIAGPGRVRVRIVGKTASNVHFARTVAIDVPETTAQKPVPERPRPREPDATPGIREYRSP